MLVFWGFLGTNEVPGSSAIVTFLLGDENVTQTQRLLVTDFQGHGLNHLVVVVVTRGGFLLVVFEDFVFFLENGLGFGGEKKETI